MNEVINLGAITRCLVQGARSLCKLEALAQLAQSKQSSHTAFRSSSCDAILAIAIELVCVQGGV